MRKAVVVGAGVGGLAVAGALARARWRVTLVERQPSLSVGRAALLLWPNGLHALRALGIGHGLDEIGEPDNESVIRRPDGKVLARWSTANAVERFGAPAPCTGRTCTTPWSPSWATWTCAPGSPSRRCVRTGCPRWATGGTGGRRTCWSPPTAWTAWYAPRSPRTPR